MWFDLVWSGLVSNRTESNCILSFHIVLYDRIGSLSFRIVSYHFFLCTKWYETIRYDTIQFDFDTIPDLMQYGSNETVRMIFTISIPFFSFRFVSYRTISYRIVLFCFVSMHVLPKIPLL